MKEIFAIDPGDVNSAWLTYNPEQKRVLFFGIEKNISLLSKICNSINNNHIYVFEMVQSYGMPVGRSVFETVFWIGRFWQAAGDSEKHRIYRSDVKMFLCNSMRAKDSNVRQVLIDRFPPIGGGKIQQIGTKKQPGPLYGISQDVWSALALAVTYSENI